MEKKAVKNEIKSRMKWVLRRRGEKKKKGVNNEINR